MKVFLKLALLLTTVSPVQKAVFFGQNHSTSGGGTFIFTGCQDSGFGSCTINGVVTGSYARITVFNLNTATATVTATSNTTVERSGDPFVNTSGSTIQYQAWNITNMTGGNITFTNTFGGSPSFPVMYVVVCQGCSTSSPIAAQIPNATAASVQAFSAPFTCGNITTTANNQAIFSSIDFDQSGTLSAGTSPQTMTAIVLNGSSGSEYGTAVTAGTNTVGYNFNNSADAMCDVVAVK